MKLVQDWQNAWKWLSVQIPTVGAACLAAWVALPDSLRDNIPHRYIEVFAIFILMSGVGGRLVKQEPKE